MDPASYTPPEPEVQRAFAEILMGAMTPVSIGLVVVYAVLAVGHSFYLEEAGVKRVMVALSGGSVLFLIVANRWVAWQRPVPERWAHLLAAAFAGVVLVNSLVHLELSRDPLQTTNLMLLLVGCGFFFLSRRWFAILAALAVAGWAVVTLRSTAEPAWIHFGFALFMTLGMSTMIFSFRRKSQRALVSARLLEAEQRRHLEATVVELRDALEAIDTLEGLLPICASCKRIRGDEGQWEQVEAYIQHRSRASFSHGLCSDCAARLYPDYYSEDD